MKNLLTGLLLAVAVLASSCASGPHPSADVPQRVTLKRCSDTPQDAISTFLQGIKEFSLTLLRAVTPEGLSLYKIFGGNDERRGKEVVRQISANPAVIGERGGCSCSLLSMTNTADPDEKIVAVKRMVSVGDDDFYYKRSFRVRFDSRGNCILAVEPVSQKWERM